jgi:hypothetical protein
MAVSELYACLYSNFRRIKGIELLVRWFYLLDILLDGLDFQFLYHCALFVCLF